MFFGEGVRRLVGMGGDALGSCDVDERVVAGFMRRIRDGFDGREFFLGMQVALVAAGDVVVDFNAEDAGAGGIGDDLVGVTALQAVGADAHVVRPILTGGKIFAFGGEEGGGGEEEYGG